MSELTNNRINFSIDRGIHPHTKRESSNDCQASNENDKAQWRSFKTQTRREEVKKKRDTQVPTRNSFRSNSLPERGLFFSLAGTQTHKFLYLRAHYNFIFAPFDLFEKFSNFTIVPADRRRLHCTVQRRAAKGEASFVRAICSSNLSRRNISSLLSPPLVSPSPLLAKDLLARGGPGEFSSRRVRRIIPGSRQFN